MGICFGKGCCSRDDMSTSQMMYVYIMASKNSTHALVK